MIDFICDVANKHQVPSIMISAEIIMDAPQSSHLKSLVDAWMFSHVHEPSWYNRYSDGRHRHQGNYASCVRWKYHKVYDDWKVTAKSFPWTFAGGKMSQSPDCVGSAEK